MLFYFSTPDKMASARGGNEEKNLFVKFSDSSEEFPLAHHVERKTVEKCFPVLVNKRSFESYSRPSRKTHRDDRKKQRPVIEMDLKQESFALLNCYLACAQRLKHRLLSEIESYKDVYSLDWFDDENMEFFKLVTLIDTPSRFMDFIDYLAMNGMGTPLLLLAMKSNEVNFNDDAWFRVHLQWFIFENKLEVNDEKLEAAKNSTLKKKWEENKTTIRDWLSKLEQYDPEGVQNQYGAFRKQYLQVKQKASHNN